MNERLKDPNEMSFLDHLEDLRWHILRSFLAIVFFGFIVGCLFCAIFQPRKDPPALTTQDMITSTLGVAKIEIDLPEQHPLQGV